MSIYLSVSQLYYPVKMLHGFSWKFHVISRHNSTWWRFGPNWHQIPWLFPVIHSDFTCCPCWNMTWILDKFKSWYLLRKCWDFHRIWSHFRTKPNCRQKVIRKPVSHFLQGSIERTRIYLEVLDLRLLEYLILRERERVWKKRIEYRVDETLW